MGEAGKGGRKGKKQEKGKVAVGRGIMSVLTAA